ncbi:MAG: DMT family transporter [bacterium]|nr:DMT family transporter [bacterium]
MSWILLALSAYTVMAGVGIVDKYFVTRRMPNALAYGFSVGALGLVFALAIPFGFSLPSFSVWLATFLSGLIFTASLIMLFWTLERGDVSRVIPTMGALFPVFTLVLAFFIVGERFDGEILVVFAVLVASSVLLSISREKGEAPALVVFGGASVVALGYALSSVLAKYAFDHHPFLSSFIWMRLAGGVTALALLLVPSWRRQIFGVINKRESGKGLLVMVRIAAGAAFITLHYAISIGPVTLVNALKGFEFAILFITTLLSSKYFPHIVRESFERKLIAMKSIGIAGIVAGLWMLAS